MFVLFRATGAEHHGGVPDRGQRVHPLQVRGDGRFLHLPGRPAPGPRTARHLPGQAGEAHQVAGCPSKPFHFDPAPPVPASHDDGSGSSSSSLVKHFELEKKSSAKISLSNFPGLVFIHRIGTRTLLFSSSTVDRIIYYRTFQNLFIYFPRIQVRAGTGAGAVATSFSRLRLHTTAVHPQFLHHNCSHCSCSG